MAEKNVQGQEAKQPGMIREMIDTAKSRANFRTFRKEASETFWNHIGPQGATELAQALYTGQGFVPGYAPLNDVGETPGGSPYGPEKTPEEQAAHQLDVQGHKQAMATERTIDKNVQSMSPEERGYAEKFREPPASYDPEAHSRAPRNHDRSRGR